MGRYLQLALRTANWLGLELFLVEEQVQICTAWLMAVTPLLWPRLLPYDMAWSIQDALGEVVSGGAGEIVGFQIGTEVLCASGCTSENACNFSMDAFVDDGSYQFLPVQAAQSWSLQHGMLATFVMIDDYSCIGCLTPQPTITT